MENNDNSPKLDMEEYEKELVMDTAYRLEDLAMALCHYDDVMAKKALSIALGTLVAHYEDPTLVECMNIAEEQIDAVNEMHEHLCDECAGKTEVEHKPNESN
jgi:hypothetical protein